MNDYNSGEHEHKYFVFKTYEGYEQLPGNNTYQKVEWAIVGCNCSSVKKVRVTEQKQS